MENRVLRSQEMRLTVANKQEIDQISGVETTGHEWDGIKELNNPLPRWWLWVLYTSIIWSIGYWIVMPAWKTSGKTWPPKSVGCGRFVGN